VQDQSAVTKSLSLKFEQKLKLDEFKSQEGHVLQ